MVDEEKEYKHGRRRRRIKTWQTKKKNTNMVDEEEYKYGRRRRRRRIKTWQTKKKKVDEVKTEFKLNIIKRIEISYD